MINLCWSETDRHDPDAEDKVAEEEQTDGQSVGQELQVLGLLAVGDEGAAQEAGVDQLHVPVLAGGHHLGLVVAVHQQGPHQGQQQRRAWGGNIFISQTTSQLTNGEAHLKRTLPLPLNLLFQSIVSGQNK